MKNAPMNSLIPQPGQANSYNQTFHPLPGPWAKEQMEPNYKPSSQEKPSTPLNGLQRALSAERSQHEYWEQWQGVTPGRPVYENPRGIMNDSLQPRAKYGTEGQGYG